MLKHDQTRKAAFLNGMKDGIPIGLGYLAVSFALGISARNAGMTSLQGFIMSILGVASAGEYAAITVIGAGAPYIEMALVTLIANARYLLMSFALSQRLSPSTGIPQRLLLGYGITDELFGLAVNQPIPLDPVYSYGSYLTAIPLWAIGTALGVTAGNLLSAPIVSALSVALYGMFLAIIVPPARKELSILIMVVLSFAASYAASALPFLSEFSGSTRVILLTVILSALAALAFPVPQEES